jgi:hypothetical protein
MGRALMPKELLFFHHFGYRIRETRYAFCAER